MWNKISLRVRIYLILTALVCITVAGSLVMVWYAYRMQGLLTHIVDRNVAAFQAAEALETALVNQKGFVSYYLLDGDPDWLRQLGEYRQIFKERLNKARSLVEDPIFIHQSLRPSAGIVRVFVEHPVGIDRDSAALQGMLKYGWCWRAAGGE